MSYTFMGNAYTTRTTQVNRNMSLSSNNIHLNIKSINSLPTPEWSKILTKKEQQYTDDELKQQMIDLARKEAQSGKDYGYYVPRSEAFENIIFEYQSAVSPDRKAMYENAMKSLPTTLGKGPLVGEGMFFKSKFGNNSLQILFNKPGEPLSSINIFDSKGNYAFNYSENSHYSNGWSPQINNEEIDRRVEMVNIYKEAYFEAKAEMEENK